MSAKRNGSIMLEDHKVNETKLIRFLTELLLTGDWSDEFNELQPNGLLYWNHILKLGLIKYKTERDMTNYVPLPTLKYRCEITTAGRKWLDEQRNR